MKTTKAEFQDFVAHWQAETRFAEIEREELIQSLEPVDLLNLRYTTASTESIARS